MLYQYSCPQIHTLATASLLFIEIESAQKQVKERIWRSVNPQKIIQCVLCGLDICDLNAANHQYITQLLQGVECLFFCLRFEKLTENNPFCTHFCLS